MASYKRSWIGSNATTARVCDDLITAENQELSLSPSGVDPEKFFPNAHQLLTGHGLDTAAPSSNTQIAEVLYELRAYRNQLKTQNENLLDAQAELRESHEKYFDLYELAPIGYFRLDSAGLIRESNRAGASMLGGERKLLQNTAFSRFIDDACKDIYFHHRRQVASGERRSTCELVLRRRDGSIFDAFVKTAQAIAGGQLENRMVIVDITERKRLEKQLLENEGRLSYLANHDPRTGIANRALFMAHLEQALHIAERQSALAYFPMTPTMPSRYSKMPIWQWHDAKLPANMAIVFLPAPCNTQHNAKWVS